MSNFVHLHVHSEYSLLDGSGSIGKLIARAKELGHEYLALTDHGNMFGAIHFYQQCLAANIKPIIGVELYCRSSDFTRKLVENTELNKQEWQSKVHRPPGDAFHLVLLAKNRKGYKSLLKIVSNGYTSGLSGSIPHVDWKVIESVDTSDVICLSACQLGELGYLASLRQLVLKNSSDQDLLDEVQCTISQYLTNAKRLFPGCFYVEIIDNNLPTQKSMIPDLVSLANQYEVPVVATADCHYLNKQMQYSHMVLTAIKSSLSVKRISNPNLNARYHMLSNEEFLDIYAAYPESIKNTLKIAESCDLTLELGKPYLPKYTLGTETAEESLIRLSKEGLGERISHLKTLNPEKFSDAETIKQYNNRLEHELKVIIGMGFPGYFLIVQDFINWAKVNGIPVGPGRGSGAGSIVAYALRITDLDPIEYNLIFERFLNPERVSMPDFDVDFCQFRREEVIQYVIEKYGRENVAQIITFGELKAKAAVKSVGRALGISYPKVDAFTKLIPNELNITLKKALEMEPRLAKAMTTDDDLSEIWKVALEIEGSKSHTSVHAAGVVISDGGLDKFVPVYRTEDSDDNITQYDMKTVEKAGLVKFDFLGLKTLTVIDLAVKIIREKWDPDFSIESISLEKNEVYDLISEGHSVGVFQLESSGMQQLIKKLKPSCIEDIIAVVALFRPGPLGSGMVDDFIDRKHGRQEISFPHPSTEDILRETYGIILYQEQVQKIAVVMANYTLGEADLLRRAMGKKIAEEMQKQKARFVDGCVKNSIDKALSEQIFDLMAKFAEYGFNKSHSAAYGLITYQTAYLKTFFKSAFMASIMTCDMNNTDKIVAYLDDCSRMGINVLPPSINNVCSQFEVLDKDTIVFSSCAIKGLGQNVVKTMESELKNAGQFQNLYDFVSRLQLSKIGKKNVEIMISAGMFDEFRLKRSDLINLLPSLVKLSDELEFNKQKKQRGLFDVAVEDCESGNDSLERQNLDMMAELGFEDALPGEQLDNSQNLQLFDLDELLEEKKLIGKNLHGHPLDFYQQECKVFSLPTLSAIKKVDLQSAGKGGKIVKVIAFTNGVSERLTKTNKKMAYIDLEDAVLRQEIIKFENSSQDYSDPFELPDKHSVIIAEIKIEKRYNVDELQYQFVDFEYLEDYRSENARGIEVCLATQNNAEIKKIKQIVDDQEKVEHGSQRLKIVCRVPNATVQFEDVSDRIHVCNELLSSLKKIKVIDYVQIF